MQLEGSMSARIRIGISSCLLGERVRYDGGHKREAYVTRTLARHFELVPVCPEVGIGMGVPRAPIQLVGRAGAVRAVGRENPAFEVTAGLAAHGRRMARALDDVSGYLFKSRSPSCGIAGVPIYDGARVRAGRGIYADAFLAAHPYLPAADESALADTGLRDNFLERVFAYRRWQLLMARGITAARLEEFHARHKLVLMAHRPRAVSELGRIVARAGRGRARGAAAEYLAGFISTLALPATPARHENALQHAMGFLKRELERDQKAELLAAIRRVRRGEPAPAFALLRRHLRRHPHAELAGQLYLHPDPLERRLRRL
jgi:uncharacterized protein YbgA (DUF1722 family)/uncharacterized protein YbbK (DUF523 family)